ncbi:MAG: c-type cytochrome [Sulfurimonas sp.]|nr:c-type cytochrome [Sulfurimonas sp.]
MKKVIIFLAVFGLSSVLMADAYTKCAVCHGANGEKVALNKSKIMSDLSKAEISKMLKEYKVNTSEEPMKKLMAAQVKDLTDADIEAIANRIGK